MTLVARGRSEGSGFELLVTGGPGVCTVEYLIAGNVAAFPADAVEATRARLTAHGIPLPQ